MKSRGCYETPGGTLIMFAHPRTGSPDARPEHAALQAAARARIRRDGLQRACGSRRCAKRWTRSSKRSAETTTGEVKLRLYKGNIEPLSRKSPYSLYSLDIASFTMGASYDQKDALGFINLIGLPIKVRAASQVPSGSRAQMKLWGGRFEAAVGGLRALLGVAGFRPAACSMPISAARRRSRGRWSAVGILTRGGARAHRRGFRRDPRGGRERRRSSKAPRTKTSTRWSSAS